MLSASSISCQIPFLTSTHILSNIGQLNATEAIRSAYLNYYDPTNPPQKYKLPNKTDDQFTLIMPYENKEDNIYFEKVIFGNRNKRPGIWGYATIYDLASLKPLAVMDATALTGYRTAAKSLLFFTLFFDGKHQALPRIIYIYGSSTQAIYHARLFSSYYPDASIYMITRSNDSAHRVKTDLGEHVKNLHITTNADEIEEDPDAIITTTSSVDPIINDAVLRTARLLIAVGSSSGDNTEVEPSIVSNCRCYVDSRISIEGKGELNIPIKMGLLDAAGVTELHDILIKGSSYMFGNNSPVLFVSKGLIIEDYVFAMRLLETQ